MPSLWGIIMITHKIIVANNDMINYACKNFHYSKSVPCGRKVAYAIFEENKFIGVIIYSLGANNNLAKSFNMVQGEVIELTRIALCNHKNNVSRYISLTLKMLKKQCKTVKIVVSYADKENQNHNGAIYQASNWIYLGLMKCSDKQFFYNGHWTHQKTFNNMAKRKGKEFVENLKSRLPQRKNSDKHKYIYVFDDNLKREYSKISKKYPKKNACVNSENRNQSVNGGASPTHTLHLKEVANG